MMKTPGGSRARGPSSDDLAHDASMPGPLRDFRKRLDGHGTGGAAFTEAETQIVFAWLPPRRDWDAAGLAEAQPEIEEFSRNPETSRKFLEERLSLPFASRMRDFLDGFARALPAWFRRVDVAPPDADRVATLQATVLRLHDLAGFPAGWSAPSPDSLPASWRRSAS